MSRYCFACEDRTAVLHRGDGGHFVVTCRDCGHERGPFISMHEESEMKEVQSSLGEFA